MYKYNAKLDRVVDGDTVDALVDLGFNTWKKVRIRMHGMNAPESRTRNLEEKAKGIAAKVRLEELLESGRFILQSMGVGKFGRCLGIIYVNDSNTKHLDVNVNKTLINEGHAVEYHGGKR
jgi:micrococcal nuclease|tara:strand:- start:1056 stop:1415 length:360 start_codon:yes stop_codon:yes gene_type:complete